VSSASIDRLLDAMSLAPGARVLDVGCGKGELLVRMAERHGIAGVGVDMNPAFLAAARTAAQTRAPGAALEFHEMDATRFVATPHSFDAAACVASTHAHGGYRQTLEALTAFVRPGGWELVGEGFWRQSPAPEYLAVLGGKVDELTDHQGNLAIAREAGLNLIESVVSTDDDWDQYEGMYARAVERYVREHPEDPDAAEMRERIARWQDAYIRWGRSTLGFALYLFRA
jgi:ubiquinone/menaquinone biosynthesis C-methylase UbiE